MTILELDFDIPSSFIRNENSSFNLFVMYFCLKRNFPFQRNVHNIEIYLQNVCFKFFFLNQNNERMQVFVKLCFSVNVKIWTETQKKTFSQKHWTSADFPSNNNNDDDDYIETGMKQAHRACTHALQMFALILILGKLHLI